MDNVKLTITWGEYRIETDSLKLGGIGVWFYSDGWLVAGDQADTIAERDHVISRYVDSVLTASDARAQEPADTP